jgi:putative ABC transport system substrate-binding protein
MTRQASKDESTAASLVTLGRVIIRIACAAFGLVLLATPIVAAAQPVGKVPRVGYLVGSSSTAAQGPAAAFRQGLRQLGWVEGKNIVIESRFAEGRYDRLPELAADLVRLKVDVIATRGETPQPWQPGTPPRRSPSS